jgi:hypothetical protein
MITTPWRRLRARTTSLMPLALVLAAAPVGALAAPDAAAAGATLVAGAAASEPSVSELTARALDRLAPLVARQSHPEALAYALRAWYAYRAEHPDQVAKPYYYFVDYGLPNSTPRGYVFDMDRLALVEGPFTVAHGRGSSKTRNGAPTRFSNRSGSAMTSLGLYRAAETYGFSGKSGGRYYRSIGLRMEGLSGRFNSAARSRGVVAHGAPYVTARDAGRSEGCPAMEEARAQRLIPMLANGGLVFLFSPVDNDWLANAPWGRTAAAKMANGVADAR